MAPQVLGHAPIIWDAPHPHNLLLALWLGFGLIGLTGFALITEDIIEARPQTIWLYPLIIYLPLLIIILSQLFIFSNY